MPAAFPAFTTISWVARAEMCAGAIRVSWATGLPSAIRETQVVFSARISRVKPVGVFSAAAGAVVLAAGGLTSGWAAGLLAEPVTDAKGDAVEDAGSECDEVVVAGMVGDDFSGGFPAGDVGPAISELAELEGWVAAAAGAETEAGDCLENGAGCDDGAGWAWRRKFHKARTSVISTRVKASLPQGIGAEVSSARSAGSPAGYF